MRFPPDSAGAARTRPGRVADLGSVGAGDAAGSEAAPEVVVDFRRDANADASPQADLSTVGSLPPVAPRAADLDALGRTGGGPGPVRAGRAGPGPDPPGPDRGPTRRPVPGPAQRPPGPRAAGGLGHLDDPTDPAADPADLVNPADANSADAADVGKATSTRAQRRGQPAEPDPDADPLAVAREICLRLLTDRARTGAELAQALRRRGVPDHAAEQVLGRFDEVGLIDDAAFAAQWVRSRHAVRGLGRRAIAAELRRKGVADDVAGDALASVDGDAERERARALVERKLRDATVSTADQRATVGRRLVGMLARKGYGPAVAYEVVTDALAAAGADLDELGHPPGLDG